MKNYRFGISQPISLLNVFFLTIIDVKIAGLDKTDLALPLTFLHNFLYTHTHTSHLCFATPDGI